MREILPGVMATAIFFGGYQLVARNAGQTNVTGTFIIAAMAMLPLSLLVWYQGVVLPSGVALGNLATAGVLMGTGFAFNIWVITHPRVEVSTAVTCIAALVVLVVTVGGMCFFRESLSVRKVAGIIFAIIAITLLRPGDKTEPSNVKELSIPSADDTNV